MVRVGVRVMVIFCVVFFCVVFFVLYFSRCIFPYCIYIINSELALTMQNIDVTQETTEKLTADQNEIEKIL